MDNCQWAEIGEVRKAGIMSNKAKDLLVVVIALSTVFFFLMTTSMLLAALS